MKSQSSIVAIVVVVVSLPFLYVYCYLPIVNSPPKVAPSECFSVSTTANIIKMVHKSLSKDVYNQLTTKQQKLINNNSHFFDRMLTVSDDYSTVLHVNRNNGSVSCNATFYAKLKGKNGDMLKAKTSGNYILFMGSGDVVFSVPYDIAYNLSQGLNNDVSSN